MYVADISAAWSLMNSAACDLIGSCAMACSCARCWLCCRVRCIVFLISAGAVGRLVCLGRFLLLLRAFVSADSVVACSHVCIAASNCLLWCRSKGVPVSACVRMYAAMSALYTRLICSVVSLVL